MAVRLKILVLVPIILAGAAAGLFLSLVVNGFFRFEDLRHELPPCFEVGEPFHHRFRPNCEGQMSTPRGKVPLRVNEDSLRDEPREVILAKKSRVLIIGDSFVEGWWAGASETISSYLGREIPGVYFINGGLRSTGPTLQARRLREILQTYKPSAILWFLNDTDGLDEKYACAISQDPKQPIRDRIFGVPELKFDWWQDALVNRMGASVLGRRARLFFYEERWKALVHSPDADRCSLCEGVEDFRNVTKAGGIPVLTFYLTSDLAPLTGHYGGGNFLRDQIVRCLKGSGFSPILEQLENLPPDAAKRYFWKDDFHLNPDGIEFLARKIKGDVERFLSSLEEAPKKLPKRL